MIARYTRPEMGRIWSNQNKFCRWLEVEVAATETLAANGIVPKSAAREIRKKAGFDVDRILAIESEVKHDVIAFTTAVAEHIGPASRWLHYGLTSNDVVDTAQALLVREASELILADLERLHEVLHRRAKEFQHTPMIGRTHGVHAEPITFGLKLANWYSEVGRDIERFKLAAEDMRVGKFSGAVGTFAHLEPELEEQMCERLGLKPAAISSQVIQRDRHAMYLCTLAVIACTLDKIATEIRHLQRTEVREAEEFFSEHQKGSSAMPHKRNPKVAERISGLARVVRGAAVVGLENVPLWHERDISHSSAERIVIPDAFLALDYMLDRFRWIVDGLVVHTDRMERNLWASHGLFFSHRLLLGLVEHGLERAEAYRLVQRNAMRAWDEERDFGDLVRADTDIRAHLDDVALADVFDLGATVANLDSTFDRLHRLAPKEVSISV
jgi:adenylosuccinate lyase